MKDLELNALFETIGAINANASEKDLYRIYQFTLRTNSYLSKLALYVQELDWECKASFGTLHTYDDVPMPRLMLEFTEMTELHGRKELEYFAEFDKVIPVKHKSVVLAYVFLGIIKKEEAQEKLDLDFINALSNIIIVAIENKKLARKDQQQKEYSRQLDIAKNVQNLLFPKKLPTSKHFTVEASYLPHHTIGGDYYDLVALNAHSRLLCIADVSGKGIPAAILMSNFQAGLRVLSKKERELIPIVHGLNELIIQNSQGENFITAFFLLYDMQEKRICFVNAGHNPPFLFTNGQVLRLSAGTTVLGSFPELPFIETGEVENLNNFLFFSFTDGFTDTYNEAGDAFGEDDLEAFILNNLSLAPSVLHAKLIALLNTFKGRNTYADDITLLSMHVSE